MTADMTAALVLDEYIARYLPAITQQEIRPLVREVLADARRQAVEECARAACGSPDCGPSHVLDEPRRLWGMCGANRLVRNGISEMEIVRALLPPERAEQVLADARRQAVEACVKAIEAEIAPVKVGKESDIVDLTWNRACRNLAAKLRALLPPEPRSGP